MNVFIREAPIEENIVSECIRTVAATYGCKMLQLQGAPKKYGCLIKRDMQNKRQIFNT